MHKAQDLFNIPKLKNLIISNVISYSGMLEEIERHDEPGTYDVIVDTIVSMYSSASQGLMEAAEFFGIKDIVNADVDEVQIVSDSIAEKLIELVDLPGQFYFAWEEGFYLYYTFDNDDLRELLETDIKANPLTEEDIIVHEELV